MKWLLILFLLPTLSTCANNSTFPSEIVIDLEVNSTIAAEMVQYIDELNTFVGKPTFSLNPVKTKNPFLIYIEYSPTPSPKRYAGVATIYPNSCTVTIYPIALKDGAFKTVLWHELAHCAGVLHVDSQDDIMSPVVRSFDTYDQATLKIFKWQIIEALTGRWMNEGKKI